MKNEINETVFEFTDVDDRACFSSSMRKWVNKAKKYAEMYPDDVRVVATNRDGSICINCPSSWFKFGPPRKCDMTEEQRKAAADRMRKAREKKADPDE